MSTPAEDTPELRQWIIRQTEAGRSPNDLLTELAARGFGEEQAVDVMTAALQARLDSVRARNEVVATDAASTAVPQPLVKDWPQSVYAFDREVRVLFTVNEPRIVLFGGLLANSECDELIAQARRHLTDSNVIDMQGGGEQRHGDRTSTGTAFGRGATPLITRIERRIAGLLHWPMENGEALQILRYAVGQQYKPHYDYVDPSQPGAAPFLARGGQRVGSLVMYLNTPKAGGATNFPDIGLEIAAVKGNAVFFSYDRPHPSTKTLHGGMPVRAGEKWVATKWLRVSRTDP
ncbi:MAG: 2OG-Fe(II) oxygenase [Gammaproteobacteria bacterium]